jgi:hypothetical protein
MACTSRRLIANPMPVPSSWPCSAPSRTSADERSSKVGHADQLKTVPGHPSRQQSHKAAFDQLASVVRQSIHER